ncbi:hypothetical protein OIO90_004691 [Microbotryomycetes sp. JL221]|nr:hypothetical protein OIO90_004691 [Microbotryomycetes sp. JL221]
MAAVDNVKHNVLHKENIRPDASSIEAPVGSKANESNGPDPIKVSEEFLSSIQAAFDAQDIDGIVKHFREDGWWRDMLYIDNTALSRTDFNTLRTKEIASHLQKFGVPSLRNMHLVKHQDAAFVPVNDQVEWIQSFFELETDKTRGRGFVRLRESSRGSGDWKAYTFCTVLHEIKGHEEFSNERRPLGAEHGHKTSKLNWLEKLEKRRNFEDTDPVVLIVGGGQNGLMLAARLTVLGIPNLIVEKNPRVGDSWRNRYKSLCLHDPVWADHFPYISYPPNWPIYCPKDKIANWMEGYAEQMELCIWLNSTVERGMTYDSESKQWSVNVIRDGKKRPMKVNHLVMATGFSGEPRLPSFPRDEYKGMVHHSSRHPGAAALDKNIKKAVVVGCCNSGHDIAQDFYEHGIDVTIVQRSHTYVMSSEHGIPGLLNGYYEENGPPLENADMMLQSLPVDLLEEYHIEATKRIAELDKPLLDGLQKAGFKLNNYPGGLFIKYFRDGGGYYIDVGASQMIADGKIKLKQGVEVEKLTEKGILFQDGEEIEADIIVLATGYTSQRETIRRVLSDEIADNIGPCWGMDKQGEIPGVWRNSGVERFYLQSGNMFQARVYSKHLATQILMRELGMVKEQSSYPQYKQISDPRF